MNLENGIDLLDMPGVLWPKFEDKRVGEYLAFTGAVKDNVVDIELLSMRLLELLNGRYHRLLCDRYKLTDEETAEIEAYDLLKLVARKRGMLQPGGEANTERAAIAVLDEFRSGKSVKLRWKRHKSRPCRRNLDGAPESPARSIRV